jgi:hypothetical protein
MHKALPLRLLIRHEEQFSIILATPAGIEPATNSLEGCCSIQLSYGADATTAGAWLGAVCRAFRPQPLRLLIIGEAMCLSPRQASGLG